MSAKAEVVSQLRTKSVSLFLTKFNACLTQKVDIIRLSSNRIIYPDDNTTLFIDEVTCSPKSEVGLSVMEM
jgi:hypothetical protein